MGASYAEAGGHLHVCILAAVTTTTASSLAPGTVLGGTYEIVRCIGSGGMGAVYEARHLRLEGRRVAVKVLLREVAESEESFARFRREAEIGARLGHPHIVAVTDFDKLDDGSPYLVMELLAGEDLSRRMGRGRVPETLTYRVVREVGGALAAAHKQGIVHRDLKPHNVFLVKVEEGEGVVEHCKVLDFGISKIAAAATVITRDAAVLGTPRYMAPEQALGKNDEIDGRTDQFALATVIYELLTGKPAFAADSSTAVLYKVVYEPAPPLREVAPQVPDEVCTAIERAMSKAPADRFPDMTSFVNAVLAGAGLGAGAMEVGLSTTKLEAGEAARRAAARRRTMLVTVGGGLGAAVIAGAIAFSVGGKKQPERIDAGPARIEAAVARIDLGTARIDAGAARIDAGPPKIDAGSSRIEPSPAKHPEPARSSKVKELPAAAAVLDEAEALLRDERYRDAVNKARQSLGLQNTPRAHRIIITSYCAIGDLGNAKAAFQQAPLSDRRSLADRCKQLGLDL